MSRPSVLLVDDYVEGLEMWELLLRLRGFDVTTTVDGANALTLATSSHPDVVVLDLDLPGMNGVEVARRLHAGTSTSDIPLIAVTGCADVTELAAARAAGFEAILAKPCDPERLLSEISRAVGDLPMSEPSPVDGRHN